MTLALRLQRHGRKSRPFYHIVATDIRNPRDGRFKEKLGYYDPNHDPSIIEINAARLQHYYRHGAQISAAVRNLTDIKKIALSRTATVQEESTTTAATATETEATTASTPAAETEATTSTPAAETEATASTPAAADTPAAQDATPAEPAADTSET